MNSWWATDGGYFFQPSTGSWMIGSVFVVNVTSTSSTTRRHAARWSYFIT